MKDRKRSFESEEMYMDVDHKSKKRKDDGEGFTGAPVVSTGLLGQLHENQ